MMKTPKLILIIVLTLMATACNQKGEEPLYKLPYPDQNTIFFYQSRIDSSEFEWLTDSKGMASAFMNEYYIAGRNVALDDIIIKNETTFRAQVEIPLDTNSVILTMERPFKDRGIRSIWQVVKMEIRPWQNSRFR